MQRRRVILWVFLILLGVCALWMGWGMGDGDGDGAGEDRLFCFLGSFGSGLCFFFG